MKLPGGPRATKSGHTAGQVTVAEVRVRVADLALQLHPTTISPSTHAGGGGSVETKSRGTFAIGVSLLPQSMSSHRLGEGNGWRTLSPRESVERCEHSHPASAVGT